ncbi:MAG TPA: SufD family Fe-S cluster assembly protein [Dissulfurispiraceae bacterium]|nr:SufD family Fe-S cluster assembly protein [Dissulfurispiraceae bacterium]
MPERDALIAAYRKCGGDEGVLADAETAHLLASGHSILSMRTVNGLTVQTSTTDGGISVSVVLDENIRLTHPVHLCFGVLHEEGIQRITIHVRLKKYSAAHFIAHCVFPDARKVQHIMDATIELEEGAEMRYAETHYHGPFGGVDVLPKAAVMLGERGRYYADFALLEGRVGTLSLDYEVRAGKEAVAELSARIFGHGKDVIAIREKIVLEGEKARGLIKTRIALEDEALAEVTGITEGNAAGARGHVDCTEIVKDNAVARAIPVVSVTHPLAKVTHEAAIGSVDKKQLETLMAHGLTPEEAVDMIVKGILR